jgi:hypothetical protein
MLWEEHEIDELQDAILKKDILIYREEFEVEFNLIYSTLSGKGYGGYFPGIDDPSKKGDLRKLFIHCFVSVVTRCFGWGLPKTSMIPFADCINHHNVDSTYELIHTRYHRHLLEEPDHPGRGPKAYYSLSKTEEDYSDFLDPFYEREALEGYLAAEADQEPASRDMEPLAEE